MSEDSILKTVIVAAVVVALACFTFGFMFSPERPEMETKGRGELIHFEGSGIVVEIITIDGVEYIVTKCRDGVGVCRK
tara:strand:+ start:689 stop:922 length:234 start_codon:yes stop_codon:yes gene_type:complete